MVVVPQSLHRLLLASVTAGWRLGQSRASAETSRVGMAAAQSTVPIGHSCTSHGAPVCVCVGGGGVRPVK